MVNFQFFLACQKTRPLSTDGDDTMTLLLKQNDLYIRYHPWQRRDVDDAEPSVRNDVA